MFGNAETERAALQSTYEDKADILRAVQKTGSNGITEAVFEPVYTGVSCALSRGAQYSEKSGQTPVQFELDWGGIVFVPPEYLVLPGDKLELYRFGEGEPVRLQVAGRPARYRTHQQIRVKESGLL